MKVCGSGKPRAAVSARHAGKCHESIAGARIADAGNGFASILLEFFILIVLALAVYRLCRLIIEDYIFESIRDRIWDRYPPESTKIGYLFTCYHCLSLWLASFVVVLFLLLPVPTIVGATILAISTLVGFFDHWKNN